MASSSTLAAADAKKIKMDDGGSLAAPEAKKAKFDNESYSSKMEVEESVGGSKSVNDSIASASSTKKMLILRSSDNETLEIEESAALASKILRGIIEESERVGGNIIVPLPEVSSKVLVLIISYLNKHHNEENNNAEEMKEMLEWDDEFFQAIDNNEMLFDLINASNYLNIKSLLDSACDEAAERMKDMTVEDAREMFLVENDFSPEEEAKVRQESAWAFEK
ncbi:SKP1-like protein 11 [Papaver somniferum]|uniref:SKP1-like protein 11 n=1 Tax=Papaver somniferum TaxID=3469 RepID=UPI000E6F9485|nr:SKP1-like protein 11 [Papaver somniferum]